MSFFKPYLGLPSLIAASSLAAMIFLYLITGFFIKRSDYIQAKSSFERILNLMNTSGESAPLYDIARSAGISIKITGGESSEEYGSIEFSLSAVNNSILKYSDGFFSIYLLETPDSRTFYISKSIYRNSELYLIKESLIYFNLRLFMIFVSSFFALTALTFYILYVHKIKKPLQSLDGLCDKLVDGDYSYRIHHNEESGIYSIINKINILADKTDYQFYRAEIEKKKLTDIFRNISDSISFIDEKGFLVAYNDAFRETFRLRHGFTGRYFDHIRNSRINSIIKTVFDKKEEYSYTINLDGRDFDIFIKPVFIDAEFQGLVISLRDITEKLKIDSFKRELVGNLSHELKTPITIMKGYLETIKSMPDENESRKRFIDKALSNLNRQNSIISDMLKLNMIETATAFEKEQVSIDSLIDSAVQILAPKFTEKKIIVNFSHDDKIKPVTANRFLAEHVFFNLIDNAASYNKPGGSISISMNSTGGGIMVTVADSGIGIPAEAQKHIFERFYRVDKNRSRETGGTGLGLSIVKHCIEILEWEISVKSEPGHGSEFTVAIKI